MKQFRNILVGVGVNEAGEYPLPSQECLNQAMWLAGKNGGKITLLTAITEEVVEAESLLEGTDSKAQQIQQVHAATIEEAKKRGITANSIVKQGDSWYEMIQAVLKNQHDLVVVGSRKVGVAKRILFGTSATRLLRKCPCPVWVTRPSDNLGVKTIVAADDLTEMGDKILNIAVATAQLMEARLLIVHAVRYPLLGGMRRTEVSTEEMEKYKESVRSHAERTIHDRLAMTDYRTIQEGTQIMIQSGAPDVVIEEAVSANNADLLVMGTIGRGGIPGLLIGNTAERLLPQLTCSVLALKPDDFKTPVS